MGKVSNFVQLDGTPKMYVSSRQDNTRLYYTSRFDDHVNNVRGAGVEMLFRNTDATSKMVVEGKFIEDIYLKDGCIMWQDAAVGDNVSMEIILPANVPMPRVERDGNYDLIDGQLVENTNGTGTLVMYPIDIIVERFVNKVLLLGTNTTGLILESSDTAIVPSIFKFRMTVESPTTNVNLNVIISMETYREHSA